MIILSPNDLLYLAYYMLFLINANSGRKNVLTKKVLFSYGSLAYFYFVFSWSYLTADPISMHK